MNRVLLSFSFVLLFALSLSFATTKDKKVVVIYDTGLDLKDPRFKDVLCPSGHMDFTGTGIKDNNGHGTHLMGLIQQYAPKEGWCAVIVKYYNNKYNPVSAERAFYYLLRLKPDYVNFSGGGAGKKGYEEYVINKLDKTRFIVSAGNNNEDLSKPYNEYYPAEYNYTNIIPVCNMFKDGQRVPSSNYGLNYCRWEVGYEVESAAPNGGTTIMTGTSMSAAIATGKIVKYDMEH